MHHGGSLACVVSLSPRVAGMVSLQGQRETTMTRFKTSDRNDQPACLLDDAALDAVLGGVKGNCIPGRTLPQTTLPTSGWTFKDVFAKPTIGV